MVYFDLEYEVELNNPNSKISTTTKTRAKTALVEQAVDAVIDYLANDCGFDASYYDNAEILKYCRLVYNDSGDVKQYDTYYGDAYVSLIHLRCYFDDDKFLQKNI